MTIQEQFIIFQKPEITATTVNIENVSTFLYLIYREGESTKLSITLSGPGGMAKIEKVKTT
jgi:predicted RNA polymerase sigma factor